MTRVCSVSGCGRPHRANGFCNRHHIRNKRHGSPTAGGTYVGAPTKFFRDALAYDGDECLIWPFSTNKGYATMKVDPFTGEHKSVYVSRMICEATKGPAPSPDAEAAHSCGCGSSGCITPAHIRWATPVENCGDRKLHGTALAGERMPTAKLRQCDVDAIRGEARGMSQAAIARKYRVHPSTISLLLSRKRWKDDNR